MKLMRLKITDSESFRSLQSGFEYHFRTEWDLEDEQGFAPFVCAGPNGSGKSNLLEVLAAIFYQLELLRSDFLPDCFSNENKTDDDKGNLNEDDNEESEQPKLINNRPDGFELEYQINVPNERQHPDIMGKPLAHVLVKKEQKGSKKIINIQWLNQTDFVSDSPGFVSGRERDFLLPEYILGYSSGENEILSLPFFKMRFIQFDEYWWSGLNRKNDYDVRPETRLTYLDNSFSQAILLCNLLFQDDKTLQPFRDDVGLKELTEFRIVLKREIPIEAENVWAFGSSDNNKRQTLREIVSGKKDDENDRGHSSLFSREDDNGIERYWLKILDLLLSGEVFVEEKQKQPNKVIDRLMRCVTCSFEDFETNTIYLDYYVNAATKQAFQENFSSAIELFQTFQVLLTLNLFTVSEPMKKDLYQSGDLYVSETVPVLAVDERIMRFENVMLEKEGVEEPVSLKSLSDGEHQLLHSLGLCLLFRNTNSLFLLDEPETHFNPGWRSKFISRLHQCFDGSDKDKEREMLITTHTPFLVSDSHRKKVLEFTKEDNQVSISKPEYNTFGASINKITMETFNKDETIGAFAHAKLKEFKDRADDDGVDKKQLIKDINKELGDSVEKVLFIKTLLDSMKD